MTTAAIILAAGQGSRMKSDLPKVLHQVGAAPLLAHVLRLTHAAGIEQRIVVTGHGADTVEAALTDLDGLAQTVRQEEQLGTGHAVQQAMPVLGDLDGDVFVLFGDTPLVRPETLTAMSEARAAGHDIVVLGFHAADPGSYGRLITRDGALEAIVEAKEASPEQLSITLCNSGVKCIKAETLRRLLPRISNDNAKGEYYLTDIVALARAEGLSCGFVTCAEDETLGINTRSDLAAAEAAFQAVRRRDALEDGVTITAPDSVWFALDTHIGRDAEIGPNVVFGPGVTVESGAKIRPFSHLEGCHVSEGAQIGPYARLRPGAEIGGGARVGNFVEVKAAQVDAGAKINHLSYVGDAHIGENANIGAGTITCNYDGVMKHRTEIGARAFIGSNSALVAPVSIGAEALVGSGSVITEDVPEGALAIGRGRQENRPGLARRLMSKLRAVKARKAAE